MNKTDMNSVLIIDDETANIIALTNILSPEYEVYAAKNGADAIKIAKESLPDVILLDILMPDMDGYEVISLLKSSEDTRSIPVIFISGLGSEKDEEKGLLLGASDYITKPFNATIVKLRVQNQIQYSSQFNIVKALSLMDELTGLFNRRGFDSRLRLEWNRARREQAPVSLMMIDIDHFKKYNDSYGHTQGDVALQTVAKIIEGTLKRPADFCARWGGEEFIVLLPDTDLAGAMNVAEEIRRNVEDTQIPCSNGHITRTTVSIGVNVILPAHDILVKGFIDEADHALYMAKKFGRNKVCIYEKGAESE